METFLSLLIVFLSRIFGRGKSFSHVTSFCRRYCVQRHRVFSCLQVESLRAKISSKGRQRQVYLDIIVTLGSIPLCLSAWISPSRKK